MIEEEQYESLQVELQYTEAQILECRQLIKKKDQEISALDRDIHELNTQSETDAKQYKLQLENITRKLDLNKADENYLKTEIRLRDNEIEKLEAHISVELLKKGNIKMDKAIADLRKELALRKKELEIVDDILIKREQEFTRKQGELSNIKIRAEKHISELKTTIDMISRKLKESSIEIDYLNKEIDVKDSQIELLADQLNSLSITLDEQSDPIGS